MPPKLTKRVTIYDIAKRTGISPMAVSLALRGEAGVSEKTRDEVRRTAESMGYAPKMAAQMLRNGKSGYIGLFLGHDIPERVVEEGFQMPLLAYFLKECQRIGQRYVVDFISEMPSGTFSPPERLTGGVLDGVILAGFVSAELRQWLTSRPEGQRIPWVGIDEPGTHCVMSATGEGVHEAVKHLYELGHRKIAFWCGPRRYSVHRNAHAAFTGASKEFGLRPLKQWITSDEHSGPESSLAENAACQAKWARDIFAVPADERPTACLCLSLVAAREVIRVVEQSGMSVPKDVSVVGLGPSYEAERLTPAITAIEPNFAELVRIAVEQLNELINNRSVDSPNRFVRPNLVVRQTSAAAPE